MGLVEETKLVLDWIGKQVGQNHEMYNKQKTIMTTLDVHKTHFYEGKDG